MTNNPSSVFYPSRVLELWRGRPLNAWMANAKRRPLYFRDWRKSKGLVQEQVAERMGVSQNTVSRIETGRIDYTRPTLEAYADALGVEPDQLLKPPNPPADEFSAYIMKLDAKKRQRALRILKAALGEEDVA